MQEYMNLLIYSLTVYLVNNEIKVSSLYLNIKITIFYEVIIVRTYFISHTKLAFVGSEPAGVYKQNCTHACIDV